MTEQTETKNFFLRYRVVLNLLCVISLFSAPFTVYQALNLGSGHTGQAIGSLLDTAITFVAVPVLMLLHIRKLKKGEVIIPPIN